jgi:hypothetical protein
VHERPIWPALYHGKAFELGDGGRSQRSQGYLPTGST